MRIILTLSTLTHKKYNLLKILQKLFTSNNFLLKNNKIMKMYVLLNVLNRAFLNKVARQ